jgi:regulator of protease activity HflC (stomatin/prohibitin superfamily)
VKPADHARGRPFPQSAPRRRTKPRRPGRVDGVADGARVLRLARAGVCRHDRRRAVLADFDLAAASAARQTGRRNDAMRKSNSLPALIFVVLLIVGFALAYAVSGAGYGPSGFIAVLTVVVASFVSYAVKIADQWERVVVLRLGRFRSLEGPGLFFIVPIVETVPYWIDTRVIASAFKAEKTLTKDTVPVDVDAVLFWKVLDAKKAALDVADYNGAISWAAQTALRDVIGKTMLADMLEGRDKISAELQKIIDERTEPWGINVISVEVKDVLIPPSLQDAMSMQAQAERERQARVILGDSERQVAEKFAEAALTYANNPTAFHLRAMNMLYEGLKRDNATIVIVPSTAVETMQLGGSVASLSAMAAAMGKAAPAVVAPGPWTPPPAP